MSCPSPQLPAPHHYSGAVKLQILVSLFSANSVWMELGTWEEAGHTSKASKVWATGGILIAWPAHKSKHYNSTLYRIQTRVVKAHSYISPLEQGRTIQFDKKTQVYHASSQPTWRYIWKCTCAHKWKGKQGNHLMPTSLTWILKIPFASWGKKHFSNHTEKKGEYLLSGK